VVAFDALHRGDRTAVSLSAVRGQVEGQEQVQPRRLRVVVVAQAAPAQGGIPTFVDTLTADPVLSATFQFDVVNTTRQAVREAGRWSITNTVNALGDAVRVYRAARRSDVVHVQTALMPTPPLVRALALCAAARLGRASVLCHAHTGLINSGPGESFRPTTLQRFLLRRLRFVDAILTVSDAGARGLSPYLSNVETVDNAVDVAGFEPAQVEASPATVLFVGTLAARKGLFDLLNALMALRAKGVAGWRAEIVGSGNEAGDREAGEVQSAFRRAGLEDAFLGPRWGAELRACLGRASIYCLPSHLEGQPIGILEAMASGLPVVSTRIGGIPDQVRDGLDGILVGPGDAVALGNALEALIASPELRGRMGESARARARERFDVARFRERMSAVYRRVATARIAG
jgi:glycosyltransferase involved in cell wall biosynthesis